MEILSSRGIFRRNTCSIIIYPLWSCWPFTFVCDTYLKEWTACTDVSSLPRLLRVAGVGLKTTSVILVSYFWLTLWPPCRLMCRNANLSSLFMLSSGEPLSFSEFSSLTGQRRILLLESLWWEWIVHDVGPLKEAVSKCLSWQEYICLENVFLHRLLYAHAHPQGILGVGPASVYGVWCLQ